MYKISLIFVSLEKHNQISSTLLFYIHYSPNLKIFAESQSQMSDHLNKLYIYIYIYIFNQFFFPKFYFILAHPRDFQAKTSGFPLFINLYNRGIMKTIIF